MAEILIAWDAMYQHPDPFTRNTNSHFKYDVIAVREDGHVWGRRESKQQWIAEGNSEATWHNKTALVKVPGITRAALGGLEDEYSEGQIRINRRMWRVKEDDLQQGLINKINTIINDAGELHFVNDLAPNERNALRNAIKNKANNTKHPNL